MVVPLTSVDGTVTAIQVNASSGVAAAWGIHHYLKYSDIGAHFSWMADNLSERTD